MNIIATATSPTSVTISWTGSGGAASYELLRTGGTGLPFFATTTGTSYVDIFAAPNTAYLYRVRAVDLVSGTSTAYSVLDLVTTVLFTDDPLVVSSTLVKATHITELRTAVNAVRALATLAPYPFTDGSLASVAIKKLHIEELRTALSEARAALALPAVSYTDPVLTSGVSTIKVAHIEDLRDGVK